MPTPRARIPRIIALICLSALTPPYLLIGALARIAIRLPAVTLNNAAPASHRLIRARANAARDLSLALIARNNRAGALYRVNVISRARYAIC